METTSIEPPAQERVADAWVLMGEQGAAVITVVFATVSICYANLADGDHARMVLSAIAALGTVTMAIVAMALRHRNAPSPPTAPASNAQLRWPAVGLVIVGAVVVVSQVLLWAH